MLRLFSKTAPAGSSPLGSPRARLIIAFCAGAFATSAVLAFAAHRTPPELPSTASAAVPLDAVRPVPSSPSTLDRLRNQAATGDELSSWQLTNALLDRFDASGDPNALYEAVVWVDRRWEMTGKAELAARVIARHCDQPVVRWHLLCTAGE